MSTMLLNELNAFRAASNMEPVAKWHKRLAADLQAFRDTVTEVPAEEPVVEVVEAPEAVKVKVVRAPKLQGLGGAAWPREGTKGAAVWAHFVQCYADGVRDTAGIVALGLPKGLNAGQMRTEVTWFRKFHGYANIRVAKEVEVKTVEVEADGTETEVTDTTVNG